MESERKPLEEWQCPPYYVGDQWDGWLVAGIGQHRDSDTVDRSNFRVLVKRLEEVEDQDAADFIAAGGDEDSELNCGHVVVRERHFLVGWIEWIAIPPHAKRSIEICLDVRDALEGYGILDEEDHSLLELEEEDGDDE